MRLLETFPPENTLETMVRDPIVNAIPEPYVNYIDLSQKRIVQFYIDWKREGLESAVEKLMQESFKDVDLADKFYVLAYDALQPRFAPYKK